MSKLPNAPLVEVIFEIRWDSKSPEELDKYAYLVGDLWASVKDRFKHREQLIQAVLPVESYIGLPAHRFWAKKNTYPLLQVGPGVLTINTLGDEYDWALFSKEVQYGADNFLKNFQLVNNEVKLLLQYIDFIPFDFEQRNVIDFVRSNLNTHIHQNFYPATNHPEGLGYYFGYNYEDGKVAIDVKTGKRADETSGLIIRTLVSNDAVPLDLNELMKWSDSAHTICSDLFKQMTKGELYNSFLK